MRSYLGVPFRSRSTRGVISLQSVRPWHYGVEELEHLVSVAEVLGYAIEQLRWRAVDRFSLRVAQLEWHAEGEREYFNQLLQALTEVWPNVGAALYTRDPSGAYRRIASSGRAVHLPHALEASVPEAEHPVRFASRFHLPADLRPLWSEPWMRGAMLVPLNRGFLWLYGKNAFTEWDVSLARFVVREVSPRTERFGLHYRLVREAELDPLTGVFNRRKMHERVRRLIDVADFQGRPFALAVVDMFDFGKVNNTHGHLVGDRVLARVAEVLRRSLRDEDDIFRLGGDEFVLLFPHSGYPESHAAVRRIAEALAQDSQLAAYGVSANFGIAVYQPGDTPETLIERADREMYAAKRKGVSVVEQPRNG